MDFSISNIDMNNQLQLSFGKTSKPISRSVKGVERFVRDNFKRQGISKKQYTREESDVIIATFRKAKAKAVRKLNGYRNKTRFHDWLERLVSTNGIFGKIKRLNNSKKTPLVLKVNNEVDLFDPRINDEMRLCIFTGEIEGKFPIKVKSTRAKKTFVSPLYDTYLMRQNGQRNIYTALEIQEHPRHRTK